MRRTLRMIAGLAVCTFAGCNDTSIGPPPGPPTLSVRDTTLLVDEMLVMPVTARDGWGQPIEDPPIAWDSSVPDVASVDGSGRVSARSPGTAVLTATMDSARVEAIVAVVPQFTHVATGETHACGITGRGELYCWGTSLRGELGPVTGALNCGERFGADTQCSAVPVRSSELRAVAIAAGGMHTCALDAEWTAYCWGANVYGQIGTGSGSDVLEPTPVAGGHRFTQLVAGRYHTCGLTAPGDAYCWGLDGTGALGGGSVPAERCGFDGVVPCSPTARLVVGGHEWSQLSATDRATCGITSVGELYCWGLDVGGSDGLYCQVPEELTGCTRTPIIIPSSKTYEVGSIGDVHRCARAIDGTLECWGANYSGRFGNGTDNPSPTPVPAGGGAVYASFVAYRTGTCGLTNVGHALCWGYGALGTIGHGQFQDALSPADVVGGHRFIALASSGSSDFVCGIAETGRTYCWGWGEFGQLGNDEFISHNAPVLVRLVSNDNFVNSR